MHIQRVVLQSASAGIYNTAGTPLTGACCAAAMPLLELLQRLRKIIGISRSLAVGW
jgi:hypothetical protein